MVIRRERAADEAAVDADHRRRRCEYEAIADDLTPTFAAVPGLLAKTWIADPEAGVAGGVYVWADAAACDAYVTGELFASMLANPALRNLRTRRYDVVGVTAPEPAAA